MAARKPNATGTYRAGILARMIAGGATRRECVQFAADEWGVKVRTADAILAHARNMLRQDFEIEKSQFIAELLSQLATLQLEARKTGQLHVALGAINSAARLAQLVS
jgi:hypothetical protein